MLAAQLKPCTQFDENVSAGSPCARKWPCLDPRELRVEGGDVIEKRPIALEVDLNVGLDEAVILQN